MLHKDDGVGAGQVEAKPAHAGRQQQKVDARVIVEPVETSVYAFVCGLCVFWVLKIQN